MDILKSLGIGQKSPEQMEVENSPVLSAMRNRRSPTFDEIMQQRRLNREQGVWFPLFDGNLRSGERLTNINGITYKIPAGIEIPPNTTGYDLTQDIPQSPQYEPQYDMSPPSARPAAPRRREITPPAPAQREMPQDVMSFRPSPNFPARLPSSTEVPMPQPRTDFTPPQRQVPIPGPGLLAPPAMTPQVEKPNMDNVLDNLMARYDGLYGQPPVVPEARSPQPQDLGLPAFTTPGYVPEGLMSPRVQQPNMIPPAVQPYRPADYDFYELENIPILSGFDTNLPPDTTIDEEGRLVYETPPGTSIDMDGNLIDADTNKILIPNYKPTPVSNFR